MPSPFVLAAAESTAVYPNFGAVGGAGQLASIIGALLTIILIAAVLMLIVCAVTWAVAGSHGNVHAASRAKTGLWIAVGSAALAGAGVTWVNFLLHVGSTL